MSVLWITSFNLKMFIASGKNLLNSFMDEEIYGNIFIGTEEGNYENIFKKSYKNLNYILYDLDESLFLKSWLKNNEDIIPENLGGKAKPCNCINPWSRGMRDHKARCHFHWFNRNASRWFRKIATLDAATKYAASQKVNYIIWIDADCEFKQPLTFEFIRDIIFNEDEADIVYLRGRRRSFLEAGLVGYNVQKGSFGFLIIQQLRELYQSNNFRKLKFWDDCHCLEHILKENQYEEYDLATTCSGNHAEVFPNSLIGEHIIHYKGRHGRKLGIMK